MTKPKYFYSTKRKLYKGKDQQETDMLFFLSPQVSKNIAKKFNLRNEKEIETAFNSYFEFLKAKDMTKFLNRINFKRSVDNVEICYGGLSNGTEAQTNITDEIITFRKNKNKDKDTFFHEFNHLFSAQQSSKKDLGNGIDTRHGIVEVFGNPEEGYYVENNDLNEGITELHAKMAQSFCEKKPKVLECYEAQTSCANSLYLIFGNDLFDAYFNGRGLQWLNDKIDGVEPDALKEISNCLTALSGFLWIFPTQAVDLMEEINERLIELFACKIKSDIFKNIDKFNEAQDLGLAVLEAFGVFSKTLFFGRKDVSLANFNREDTFNLLVDTYLETLYEISDYIRENPHKINFVFDPDADNFGFFEPEDVFDLFQAINDESYMLVSWDEKPVDVLAISAEDMLSTWRLGKANYVREIESNISKTQHMKDYFYYLEKYEESRGIENSIELKKQEQILELFEGECCESQEKKAKTSILNESIPISKTTNKKSQMISDREA